MSTAHDKALAVREDAEKKFDQIRADATLSRLGRQRAMAPILLDVRRQIEHIAWQSKVYREQRVQELQRSAFGVAGKDPMSVLSHRDAVDRATAIADPGHALKLLERALADGDTDMARAIARNATEMGWPVVLDTYTTAVPEAGQAIAELSSLNYTVDHALQDGAYFRVDPPEELERHDDHDLQQIIDGETVFR